MNFYAQRPKHLNRGAIGRWQNRLACLYNARLSANVAQSVEQLIRNQ